MRTCLILIFTFSCIFSQAKAQYSPKSKSLKVSSGVYFLGSSDILMPKIVNIRAIIQPYYNEDISSGISIGFMGRW